MALPFLVPMLLGAVAGAATNKEDRLRGALLGGTLGAVTGGLGGLATPAAQAGTQAAVQTGTQAALAEGTKGAVAGEVAKQAGVDAAKQAAAKQAAEAAAKKAALQKAQQEAARQAAAKAANTGGGQVFNAAELGANVNPATTGFNPSIQAPGSSLDDILASATEVKPSLTDRLGSAFKSNNLGVSQNPGATYNSQVPTSSISKPPASQSLFGQVGQTARAKPLETMRFASSLSPQQQQQQQRPQVVSSAPVQQKQMTPPPSVEEKIAASGGSGPTFIPRGLFDEARNEFDEEDRYNSRARNAALFS